MNSESLAVDIRRRVERNFDEYVELGSLVPLTAALALTILEWCGWRA
jgi:hypothetical protein